MEMFCKFSYRDVDGAIVRPLPRAKRMLSEASCLPHIVQVSDIHTMNFLILSLLLHIFSRMCSLYGIE